MQIECKAGRETVKVETGAQITLGGLNSGKKKAESLSENTPYLHPDAS